MTYTPIEWKNGDTITAEKMNKMDNGWSVSDTQLFSETVTVQPASMGNAYIASFEYTGTETPETILVDFNGTEYTCTLATDQYATSQFILLTPTFGSNSWQLITYESGTYNVAVSAVDYQISSDFKGAVDKCVGAAPLPCFDGITTFAEMNEAYYGNRLLYASLPDDAGMYIITSFIPDGDDAATLVLTPTPEDFTAEVADGVFTITWL